MSGQQLGRHGPPMKAQIGPEEVFLCCKGCLGGQVKAEHWARSTRTSPGRSNLSGDEKALPESPKWTIVEGQIVYVCCPPCTKQIAADPKTYVSKVNALYAASLKSQTQSP